MDENTLNYLTTTPTSLVTANHMRCALEAVNTAHRQIRLIIHQRILPNDPTPEATILLLLSQLAALDSNNFHAHAGVGEREGRVYSSLVRHRHFQFSHGVGRSGELSGSQPKAAGSSLLYSLTNCIALDVLRAAGLRYKRVLQEALVLPVATGMALTSVLMTIGQARSSDQKHSLQSGTVVDHVKKDTNENGDVTMDNNNNHLRGKYVVWCRIDQKTCLKSIIAAGLRPVVVNLRRATKANKKSTRRKSDTTKMDNTTKCFKGEYNDDDDDTSSTSSDVSILPGKTEQALQTNNGTSPHKNNKSRRYFLQSRPNDIKKALERLPGGPSSAACVLITTSCFAPRLPDDPLDIARICKELQVPLVINNAYGVQSSAIMKRIDAATIHGRVDCVVQSTDKNFMVPVGGAIICGPSAVVNGVSSLYPGRASLAPILDLFITLLEMGKCKYLALAHTSRMEMRLYFLSKLEGFCNERGESVVADERNDVSFGVTLRNAWNVKRKDEGTLKENKRNVNNKTNLKRGVNKEDGDEERHIQTISMEICSSDQNLPQEAREMGETPDKAKDYNKHYSDDNEDYECIKMNTAALDIGSKLYHLGVSGPRVVSTIDGSKVVCGIKFTSYGMHGHEEVQCKQLQEEGEEEEETSVGTIQGQNRGQRINDKSDNGRYSIHFNWQQEDQQTERSSKRKLSVPPMLIFACAIGITRDDIDLFLSRLKSVYPPLMTMLS